MAPNDVEMAPNDVEVVVPLPKMAAPLMRHSLPRFAVPALPLESATYAGSVSLPVTSAKKWNPWERNLTTPACGGRPARQAHP